MAGTKFAYVRSFELPDAALPCTYMAVRIDGKGFHNFSEAHNFAKPNDPRALELMNEAARFVMSQLKGQVTMAFGESDEFSFLLRRDCTLYSRRVSKITTHIVSLFTSSYVLSWSRFFATLPLLYPPSFDGRLVVYPSSSIVRDYFSWRQADTHVNNLYNTTFWTLVQHDGQSQRQATETLRGTLSKDKHEILWKFGVNYHRELAIFRKGSTIVWYRDTLQQQQEKEKEQVRISSQHTAKRQAKKERVQRKKSESAQHLNLITLHCDIIGEAFWDVEAAESSSQPRTQAGGTSTLPGKEDPHPQTISHNHNQRHDQPWNDRDRLRCRGMGRYVFLP